MSWPLLRLLARRLGLGCLATGLLPVLLGVMAGTIWPDYRDQMAMIEKLGIMKMAKVFFRSDLIPSNSATFIFQLPFMHPVSMLAMIVAMALAPLAFPAGARGRGTLDLLLATPLTRRKLVATTFLFTLPFALLHALAPLLGVWIGAKIAAADGELPFGGFARVSIESFALALFFAGLTQLLSVGLRRRGALRGPEAGAAVAALSVIVLYSLLAETFGTWWTALHWLKYATPFGWFEPPQVLAGVAHLWRDSAVLAGGGLLCVALALIFEERRRSV